MSATPPLGTPLGGQISAENYSPAITTITYLLLVTTLFFYSIRLISAILLKRKFGWDDAFLAAAVCVAIAQSVCTERAAHYGLGRYLVKLPLQDAIKSAKFQYASNIQSILAQTLAKASMVQLMKRLSWGHSVMKTIFVVMEVIIVSWLLLGIFAIAFQCKLPSPWIYLPTRCYHQGVLWCPVLVLDILIDLALSLLFLPILWGLQMKLSQRLTIISLFGMRLIVCGTAIGELVSLVPALKSFDPTRDMVVPTILNSVTMNLSVLCATAPSLHRFLNELHSLGFASIVYNQQYEQPRSDPHGGNYQPTRPTIITTATTTTNNSTSSRTTRNLYTSKSYSHRPSNYAAWRESLQPGTIYTNGTSSQSRNRNISVATTNTDATIATTAGTASTNTIPANPNVILSTTTTVVSSMTPVFGGITSFSEMPHPPHHHHQQNSNNNNSGRRGSFSNRLAGLGGSMKRRHSYTGREHKRSPSGGVLTPAGGGVIVDFRPDILDRCQSRCTHDPNDPAIQAAEEEAEEEMRRWVERSSMNNNNNNNNNNSNEVDGVSRNGGLGVGRRRSSAAGRDSPLIIRQTTVWEIVYDDDPVCPSWPRRPSSIA